MRWSQAPSGSGGPRYFVHVAESVEAYVRGIDALPSQRRQQVLDECVDDLGREADHFLRRFANAGRPGADLRILESGELRAGYTVEVVHRPEHGLTVSDVAHIYLCERRRASRLLEAPELPTSWHDWARERRRG